MDRGVIDPEAGDVLASRVAATPDRLAVVDAGSGNRRSYAELDTAVADLAGRLASVGVGAGDRVALRLETSVDAVRAVHAILRLGAVPVPLDPGLATDELQRRIGVVGASHLVRETDAETAVMDATGGGDAEPFHLVSLDDDRGPVEDGGASLDDVGVPLDDDRASIPDGAVTPIRSLDRAAVPETERRPDEVMLVVFTSGTTGPAKAVRLTARNVRASAVASAFRLGVDPGDRWLCPLPIHHMGGLAPVLRSALYGTTVVIQEGFDAERTGRATREHGATGISLVPTMLHRIFESGVALSGTLRFVLLGGAPADESLVAECEERGVPVYPTYGTTETASQIATATPEEAFDRAGTVGHPLLGTDVRIVDGDGTEQPAGEVGEIAVSGPTVTPGYVGGDGAAFGAHGLRTGDRGYRDGAGRLYVVGRADDVIVTGGENVPPGEVESILREHPGVRDAAVVGLDDPEWGERVAALVVADDSGSADPVGSDELRGFCRERLAGFETPKTIRVADALPRTASGTVDREAVRERLRN